MRPFCPSDRLGTACVLALSLLCCAVGALDPEHASATPSHRLRAENDGPLFKFVTVSSTRTWVGESFGLLIIPLAAARHRGAEMGHRTAR